MEKFLALWWPGKAGYQGKCFSEMYDQLQDFGFAPAIRAQDRGWMLATRSNKNCAAVYSTRSSSEVIRKDFKAHERLSYSLHENQSPIRCQ